MVSVVYENLIGHKFGNLTVIDSKYLGKGKRKTFFYICQCGCGAISKVRHYRIKNSLGCPRCARVLSFRKIDPKFITPFYSLKRRSYLQYIKRAKAKNLDFDLTEEQVFKFFDSPCFYCGCLPETKPLGNSVDGKFKRNGLDRKDSNLGYTENNVVPCCKKCNLAKLDTSFEEFMAWIKRVYGHSIIKK